VISAWRLRPTRDEGSRHLDIAFMLERQSLGAFSRKIHFVDFIQKSPPNRRQVVVEAKKLLL
jgi:hypothetical protein